MLERVRATDKALTDSQPITSAEFHGMVIDYLVQCGLVGAGVHALAWLTKHLF